MWLHYIEDELGAPLVAEVTSGLGPLCIRSLGESTVTTKDRPNVHVLLGRSDDGWDWVLHNLLADASTRFGVPVIELAGFEDESLALGVFDQILLQLEAVIGRAGPLLKLIEKYQDALNLLSPQIVRAWLPGSTIPLPYPPGVLPELEDTSFVDSMLNELSGFLAQAFRLAHSSTDHTPILGITNAQWFDKLSTTLVSRLCRSASGQPFSIYIHIDTEGGDSSLLRLAQSLAQFGWATVNNPVLQNSPADATPLARRDAYITSRCASTQDSAKDEAVIRVCESASDQIRSRLLIAAFANREVLENELNNAAMRLAGTRANPTMPDNQAPPSGSRGYVIHPRWRRIIRAKMRNQSNPVLEVLAMEQRQTHGPLHNWRRSMLHLMAQEGCWSEFHSKISECGFCLHEQFGERKAAITFCEAARSKRRDDAELAAHLAWLYSLEDKQKAVQLYGEALELRCSTPLRILMLCRLAVLLAKAGNWLERGSGLVDEAVTLTSQLVSSMDSLEAKGRIANAGAFLLYRAGRLLETLDVLRDADLLLGSAPPALLQLRFLVRKNIAKVLQRKGSADCEVVDAYQRILHLCPDRRDPEQVQYRIVALFALGIVHAESGLPSVADEHFRTIIELPYPSFRMSVPALCRYAGDLFARLRYYDYARTYAEIQIEYYMANNRIYDALAAWRAYATKSLEEWSALAIPGTLQNVASHLVENEASQAMRLGASHFAVSDRADKSRHAAPCLPIAPV